MKQINQILIVGLLISLVFACNNSNTTENSAKKIVDTTTIKKIEVAVETPSEIVKKKAPLPEKIFRISESGVEGISFDGNISEDLFEAGFEPKKETKTVSEEGTEYEVSITKVFKDKKLAAVISDRSTIEIITNDFLTPENLGVGILLKDVLETYKGSELGYSYISERYFIENNKYNLSFILNPKDFIGDESKLGRTDYDILKLSDFKEDARVVAVFVYKS